MERRERGWRGAAAAEPLASDPSPLSSAPSAPSALSSRHRDSKGRSSRSTVDGDRRTSAADAAPSSGRGGDAEAELPAPIPPAPPARDSDRDEDGEHDTLGDEDGLWRGRGTPSAAWLDPPKPMPIPGGSLLRLVWRTPSSCSATAVDTNSKISGWLPRMAP